MFPRPELVLYVLGGFLCGYGLWLAVRARRAGEWRGVLSACPSCGKEWTVPDAGACGKCGVRRPVASAIEKAGMWVGLGVLTSALGIVAMVGGYGVAGWIRSEGESFGPSRGVSVGPIFGAGMGVSLFGVFLLVLAWRGDRARGRRRCPKCWYLIDAVLGLKCSECGHEAGEERHLFRTRRRTGVIALAVGLVAVGQAGWLESRVRTQGWMSLVPTEAMILAMPWLPDHLVGNSGQRVLREWSLLGRFEEGHMWEWQEDWFLDRSAGWLLGARDGDELARRLDVLERSHTGSLVRRLTDQRAREGLTRRCLDEGVRAMERGATTTANTLLGVVWEVSTTPTETPGRIEFRPSPEVQARVDELAPTMVQHFRVAPLGAGPVLGLGSGGVDVVESLLELANTQPRLAVVALRTLQQRYRGTVSDRLAQVIADPSDPRRVPLARSLGYGLRDGEDPAVESAILALLSDPDPAVAVSVIGMAALSSPGLQAAGLRRGLELLSTPSEQAPIVANLLAEEYNAAELREHLPTLLALSRHENAEIRAAVAFVLVTACTTGAPVEESTFRRIEEMLDTGVELPVHWSRDQVREWIQTQRNMQRAQEEFEAQSGAGPR